MKEEELRKRSERLRKRFNRSISLTLHCRIITPMFLGDAFQEAALRPEPFKGLLRYWWRVAAGRNSSWEEMLKKENKVFGSGGEEAQKSLVKVEVSGEPEVVKAPSLPSIDNIRHPEVKPLVNPLLYLGYGPIVWQSGQAIYNRSYLKPGEQFQIKITFPNNLMEDETFKTAILYFKAFGAIGARSRNGWGSFQVEKIEPEEWKKKIFPSKIVYAVYTENLFNEEHDYPHTLSLDKTVKDKPQTLLWRTKYPSASWGKVMEELARIYVSLRTSLPVDGTHDIDERHLLGFPITNHYAVGVPGWGKRVRHASPLRLFVRRRKEGYFGFVLHIPFGISKSMRKNASGRVFFTPKKQKKIWQKVHNCLDKAMQRVSINACL